MNKVIHINLGGFALTMDEDAYESLGVYLGLLKQHFSKSADSGEIVADIEARMGELLKERMGEGRTVVSVSDVNQVIAVMGTPEDFGVTEETAQAANASSTASASGNTKGQRRFFRDPDDRVIAGVCSGLAANFGIADPLWVRLFFVGLFFVFGWGIVLYAILALLAPEAKSSADRLAMHGLPVNVDNIARQVAAQAEPVSTKMGQFVNDIGGTMRPLVSVLIKIMYGLIIFTCAGIVLALVIGFGGMLAAGNDVVQDFLLQDEGAWMRLKIAVPLAILLPIFGVILLCVRGLTNTKFNPFGIAAFWTLWLILLLLLTFEGVRHAKKYQNSGHTVTTYSLDSLKSDILRVEMGSTNFDNSFVSFGDAVLSNDTLLVRDAINLNIEEAVSGSFRLERRINSRGENTEQARSLARAVIYPVTITNNAIVLPEAYALPAGALWRGQQVSLTLFVPKDKRVELSGDVRHELWHYWSNDDMPDNLYDEEGKRLKDKDGHH